MKQVCVSKYLIWTYYSSFQDYKFLIPSETDSNMKLYHISSAHSFLLFLKLEQIAFLSFCGKSERMGVKIDQVGEKPMNTPQHTEIYFCTQLGFKWLENIKKSFPHFHMLIPISMLYSSRQIMKE